MHESYNQRQMASPTLLLLSVWLLNCLVCICLLAVGGEERGGEGFRVYTIFTFNQGGALPCMQNVFTLQADVIA